LLALTAVTIDSTRLAIPTAAKIAKTPRPAMSRVSRTPPLRERTLGSLPP
jgi:hypothetical protein